MLQYLLILWGGGDKCVCGTSVWLLADNVRGGVAIGDVYIHDRIHVVVVLSITMLSHTYTHTHTYVHTPNESKIHV